MAAAAEEALGDRIAGGVVVVKDGHLAPTRRVRILEAGHPVPDERGAAAARAIHDLVGSAEADDLVLVLISGGGSALTPAPAPPITLAEKQALTRLMLRAGATINELNAVRKHCSLLKGGQLARAAAPARVHSLLLSDVIGDPLDVIASGPTAPDESTYDEALAILVRFGIATRWRRSIRRRLEQGRRGEIPETPKPGDPLFARVTNTVIGNNHLVIEAAVQRARALGFTPHLADAHPGGRGPRARRPLREHGPRRARGDGPAPAALLSGGGRGDHGDGDRARQRRPLPGVRPRGGHRDGRDARRGGAGRGHRWQRRPDHRRGRHRRRRERGARPRASAWIWPRGSPTTTRTPRSPPSATSS